MSLSLESKTSSNDSSPFNKLNSLDNQTHIDAKPDPKNTASSIQTEEPQPTTTAKKVLSMQVAEMSVNDVPLIGIPSQEETIVISEHSVTLETLIIRERDSSGEFHGESYYPIAADIPLPANAIVKRVAFFQAYSDQYNDFLLPVKGSGNGRPNSWNRSLSEIANTTRHPFFLQRIKERRIYLAASDDFTCMPDYEPLPFEELLNKAFEGNIIDSVDHPIIKNLNQ